LNNVVELGSYDVNGSIRNIIDLSEYIGVDLIPGPNVDWVGHAHNFESEKQFSLVISSEALEHDENWQLTFTNMIKLCNSTDPNSAGYIIFTCASRGIPEHGTSRSDISLSPGTSKIGSNYYGNLEKRDFIENFDFDSIFQEYAFISNNITFDLYFVGARIGSKHNFSISKFKDELVIKKKTSAIVPRIPLYLLIRVLPIGVYNNFAFRYWNLLLKLDAHLLKGIFTKFRNKANNE
jgi:hypothetical protein